MQLPTQEFTPLIMLVTFIFLLVPSFLFIYFHVYNSRKKRRLEETIRLEQEFATEILKTRIEVHENTLQAIGANLHDNIGNLVNQINLTLKSLTEQTESLDEKITNAIDLTNQTLTELNFLDKLFQGKELKMGLPYAIKHELLLQKRIDKFKYVYINSDQHHISQEKQLVLFRIFQEIIKNITRHAEATLIQVEANFCKNVFIMDVRDNGKGFNTNLPMGKDAMGLHHMYRRARMINAEAIVKSQPGAGTHISIQVQL
ncbi:sensor histidine kinase [Pedobacter sp. AW31-3R]|uniref:sensor histidine kinase n=1 Tax=Pedobacter sp. AW31-3R TaxID=3445781 RepID=UPI003FA0BA3A